MRTASSRLRIALTLLTIALSLVVVYAPAWAGESFGADIFLLADATHTLARGSSTLVIDDHGITLTMTGSGLRPHNAWTMWLVIFNHPEMCVVPNACGEADVFAADGSLLLGTPVDLSINYGGGGVTDGYGQLTTTGHVAFDGTSGVIDIGPGVTNPCAEHHGIWRDHKAALLNPSKRDQQLSDFDTGCGSGGCTDIWAAVHRSHLRVACN